MFQYINREKYDEWIRYLQQLILTTSEPLRELQSFNSIWLFFTAYEICIKLRNKILPENSALTLHHVRHVLFSHQYQRRLLSDIV